MTMGPTKGCNCDDSHQGTRRTSRMIKSFFSSKGVPKNRLGKPNVRNHPQITKNEWFIINHPRMEGYIIGLPTLQSSDITMNSSRNSRIPSCPSVKTLYRMDQTLSPSFPPGFSGDLVKQWVLRFRLKNPQDTRSRQHQLSSQLVILILIVTDSVHV